MSATPASLNAIFIRLYQYACQPKQPKKDIFRSKRVHYTVEITTNSYGTRVQVGNFALEDST